MLEGIIFDMDGVLIDSHPAHRAAWRKFLTTVGRNVSEAQLDFIQEGRRREDILRHFFGSLPQEVVDEYGRRKDQFFLENFDCVQLIPGVEKFLESLEAAHIRAAVATSASSGRTWATLRGLKLDKCFAAVVTGDDVSAGKPDPAVYRLAADRMNRPPEALLVLEDAPSGVQAAKAAGMYCIGVASNGRTASLLHAGADHIIPDFRDFSLKKTLDIWTTIATPSRSISPAPV